MKRDAARYLAYKITNTVNGRSYVGVTGQSVEQRFARHWRQYRDGTCQTKLARAMRKHGPEKFSIHEIACAASKGEILELEVILIRDHRTYYTDGGYNMTLGGDGFSVPQGDARRAAVSKLMSGRVASAETRQKMAEAAKKRWKDQSYRDRVVRTLSAVNTGKPVSAETREKRRVIMLARYQADPGLAARLTAPSDRRKRSPEQKERQSIDTLKRFAEDPEYGKRISLAKTGTKASAAAKETLKKVRAKVWEDPAYRARMLPIVAKNMAKAHVVGRSDLVGNRNGHEKR